MNILYTITRYWPAIGGAETHVRQVAGALSSRHRIEIMAHTNRQRVDPVRVSTVGATQTEVYRDGDIRVHLPGISPLERLRIMPAARLYPYPATKPLGYRFYASVFARKLSRIVQEHRIQLIHNVLVGTEYLSHVSCQVAHRHGLPFVITPLVHEGIWGDAEYFFQVYRRADAVIALLDIERRLYLQHGVAADRAHVIGVSPVIAKTYDPHYFIRQHGLRDKIVLFVGRHVPGKGYRELLEAAPLVWARHTDVSFVFIGPHEKPDAAFERHPDPRIHRLGQVSDEEKTSAFAACDVFCLPSISEIMPTAILEAWHFGKPVIGGDIPALRELIGDGEAGLIVKQQIEDIAAAILRLLDDPAYAGRLGACGREKVQHDYTPERVAGRLEAVYAGLVT